MGAKKLDVIENLTAKIEIDTQSWDVPIVTGTEGEKSLDIRDLRAKTGYVTLDPAFMNTASTTSQITYLDGEKGILQYRGYPIEELASKESFLDVAHLLIYGEKPTKQESEKFFDSIKEWDKKSKALLEDRVKSLPKNLHPMAALSSNIVSLSGDFPQFCHQDLSEKEKFDVITQLMAFIKCLASCYYRHSNGLYHSTVGASDTSYAFDFLKAIFGQNPSPEVEKALNVLLILHADHEQNCSTSTVRLVGSSKANPYAVISSGINALWGPLHGGANEEVIMMLEHIAKEGGDYKAFINKAKDKNDPFKLMGFGHRVYKNFDPRAQIIKKNADQVLKTLNVSDPLLEIARGLEEAALKDPYFVERKLYPNVDFYSGIIYRALGIPSQMFTVMFAIGRLPGWLAHWKEMTDSPQTKIGRPRQIYTGKTRRE